MKNAAILFALMPLMGCHHMLIVCNIGIANKTAASLDTPLTPQTFCLALMTASLKTDETHAQITDEETQYCQNVLRAQAQKEKR